MSFLIAAIAQYSAPRGAVPHRIVSLEHLTKCLLDALTWGSMREYPLISSGALGPSIRQLQQVVRRLRSRSHAGLVALGQRLQLVRDQGEGHQAEHAEQRGQLH